MSNTMTAKLTDSKFKIYTNYVKMFFKRVSRFGNRLDSDQKYPLKTILQFINYHSTFFIIYKAMLRNCQSTCLDQQNNRYFVQKLIQLIPLGSKEGRYKYYDGIKFNSFAQEKHVYILVGKTYQIIDNIHRHFGTDLIHI